MKSGSKRSAGRPPELAAWQHRALRLVATSSIGREVVFGGGAALAALHLHHRTSEELQAVLTRKQPRDFVDLYFLLREGPLRDLDVLLTLVRSKFDAGPHRLGLAARLLLVHEVRELPRMIRPVTLRELVRFFEQRARDLARSE